MPEGSSVLSLAVDAAFIMVILAASLAVLRLARGPSLPDRVVALDLITVLAVAFCALFAIAWDNDAFLDVAIALALVAFLATVALARFAERRSASREELAAAQAEKRIDDAND
ncbi:MAG: cation:proton antiporter [Alphaproteobacteria bacterium]|nr:cation:proton antiporter [Alphaproteobacteria bacterium]MCY4231369.1 cation:proton antiporter [Alphaproteobacteria bacterium]MCY4320282.1 cation:proton antiporter [Alphaproteobacteria bacterium]